MVRLVLLALLTLLIPLEALAFNGVVAPPTLVKGQQVYTIPEGYTRDGLNATQVAQLNGELNALHFPFYVLVLEHLPDLDATQREYARANGFRGDENTLRIEVLTARLMEDWATQDGFNPGTTSVFVLVTTPRKYAWHPGLTWKNNLGLDTRGQEPYTALFLKAAKTKPADYGSGIGNLARSLDEFVFDQTDPERVATRKEAARVQAEAEAKAAQERAVAAKLAAAQGALDSQIVTLATLLGTGREYLPKDVSAYHAALDKANMIRAKDNPVEMATEAEALKGSVDVLFKFVKEARAVAFEAMLRLMLQWFVFLAGTGLLLFFILQRRKEQKLLLSQFHRDFDAWTEKVSNAQARWSDLYLQRDGILGLNNVSGKTKALWDETTQVVDEILIRIMAMHMHLTATKAIFDRGHYLNFKPLRQACLTLDAPFLFNTTEVNEADLFGGETITKTVDPSKFAEETRRMFAVSIEGWKRLQKAADERLGDVAEDFPHNTIDRMFKFAEQWSIPTRWFQEHPLFGSDAADSDLYTTLTELRNTDPLAYVEKIVALKSAEEVQLTRLMGLVGARRDVKQARVETPFDTLGTVVSPDDDPTVTIASARQAEARFDALFVTAPSLDEIKEQAQVVIRLYTKVAKQGAELEAAIKGCQEALEAIEPLAQEAQAAAEGSAARLDNARKLFMPDKLEPVEQSLKAVWTFIQKGNRKITEGREALRDRRHLAARRLADEAVGAFKHAKQHCVEANSQVTILEKERALYLERAAKMGACKATYEHKMQAYGGHTRPLEALVVTMPTADHPADYASLIAALNHQESRWRAACREAESAYEDQQRADRRRREAAEAAERQALEAERRRQSSYASSYSSRSSSSSSSSSYGGGGFGGSSGDSGGGGFGGSSGDY